LSTWLESLSIRAEGGPPEKSHVFPDMTKKNVSGTAAFEKSCQRFALTLKASSSRWLLSFFATAGPGQEGPMSGEVPHEHEADQDAVHPAR
jgi:hypothetical protein